MTMTSKPIERLRHHVTGAIERGEAQAITEQRAAHTPGPWIRGARLLDVCAGASVVATVACASSHPATEEQAHANARLIAAAPDLLAALEQCLTGDGANCLAYGTDTPSMRRRFAEINRIATEAIRKAKGE